LAAFLITERAGMAWRNFVLDMDVGIDDAIAILYLAAQPEANCCPGKCNYSKAAL
jgi:hypothetical protein